MKGYVIGVDLGGTWIKAAALNFRGKLLAKTKASTQVKQGPEKTIANIVSSVERLKKRLKGRPLLAVGVGVPGILKLNEGLVIQCPNLPGWDGLRLRERLEKEIKVPVVMENDANAAALGEKWLGAARGTNNFMLITLGTGVGSGIVLEGKLWPGEAGRAGEVGHTRIEAQGIRCGCGSLGCLEQYTSATAIKRMATAGVKKGKSSMLWELSQRRLDKITPELVQKAALKGDPFAQQIYQKVGRYLGIGMANVVNLLDISHFVLAGGVSNAYSLFIDSLGQALKEQVMGKESDRIKILRSQCGVDAGMYGCAYLAISLLSR